MIANALLIALAVLLACLFGLIGELKFLVPYKRLIFHQYRFDMKTFTELRNAQSVTIAYDGLNPMPPMFCYLKPYFNDPNKSYFRQAADGEL